MYNPNANAADLFKRVQARYAALGDVTLPSTLREPARTPPDLTLPSWEMAANERS